MHFWRAIPSIRRATSAAAWYTSVLAVTFTNKAANELRERLSAFGIQGAESVWAMTFHSACVRILRRDIDRLGFSRDFTIYDTDDSKRVIKDILKELNIDEKKLTPREVLSAISNAKDAMESHQDYSRRKDLQVSCGRTAAAQKRRQV